MNAEKTKKSKAWREIKERAPDAAVIIAKIGRHFGPLSYVRVMFNDGTVIEVDNR